MIINNEFTTARGYKYETMRTEFDRNYEDEGTAIVFIQSEEDDFDGYYEVNVCKDKAEFGKLTENAYICVYDSEDETEPSQMIYDVAISLKEHDFDPILAKANADLLHYGLMIVLEYDGECYWAIGVEDKQSGKIDWYAENDYDSELAADINECWVHTRAKVFSAMADAEVKNIVADEQKRMEDTKNIKDFYSEIKKLHNKVVMEIKWLMAAHETAVVDLLGGNADHAYVTGYPSDGCGAMTMEVSKVYLVNGVLSLDVILDVDTDELAASNENGDIGDAYQCWNAEDYTHFIPCAGIESVYESVYQTLNNK